MRECKVWFSEGRSSDCQGFFEWGYSGSTPGWYLPVAHLSRLKIRLISYRWFMISMLVSCYSSNHQTITGPWFFQGTPAINLAPAWATFAGLGCEIRGCCEPDCQRHAYQGFRQHRRYSAGFLWLSPIHSDATEIPFSKARN